MTSLNTWNLLSNFIELGANQERVGCCTKQYAVASSLSNYRMLYSQVVWEVVIEGQGAEVIRRFLYLQFLPHTGERLITTREWCMGLLVIDRSLWPIDTRLWGMMIQDKVLIPKWRIIEILTRNLHISTTRTFPCQMARTTGEEKGAQNKERH